MLYLHQRRYSLRFRPAPTSYSATFPGQLSIGLFQELSRQTTNSPQVLDHPFSLQHLPYGIVRFGDTRHHLAVRFEDYAISLDVLRRAHRLKPVQLEESVTRADSLTPFITLPTDIHRRLRQRLQTLISRGEYLEVEGSTIALAPYPQDDPKVACPVKPTDFVDFYCSRHHAFRVGCLFRGPENALPEQYFDLPIGYHGRSGTIVVSGTPVERPTGIVKTDTLHFAPSRRLDYELEVGFVLCGHHGRLSPDQAWEKIFGLVLVNDWSARDIQAYEYKPLGPFLGKSFATTVGAWVTPLEALEEHRQGNTDSQHPVLPHLRETGLHHFELPLFAELSTGSGKSLEVTRSNLSHLAWSAAQMVAHLSSNGTRISAGDLIATGTVSGPERGAEGCLLERTAGGKEPLEFDGESREFLHDGDTVTLLGGHPGVALAPCRGSVVATPKSRGEKE